MDHEKTTLSGALWGFYASCTGFGIGATVAAAALIVFADSPSSGVVATVSIVITAICAVLSWWTLKVARGD